MLKLSDLILIALPLLVATMAFFTWLYGDVSIWVSIVFFLISALNITTVVIKKNTALKNEGTRLPSLLHIVLQALKVLIFFILIISSVILLRPSLKHPKFTGSLVQSSVPELKLMLREHQIIEFSSTGGFVAASLEISKIMRKQNTSIVVTNECMSSCAEIILPSSTTILFRKFPFIAYHGNILSYEYMVSNFAKQGKHNCNWVYAREIESIYEQTGHYVDFWKVQMSYLQPNIEFRYNDGQCPRRIYNFKNSIWLPTSSQLREQLKLKFTGAVCADDFNTCSKRIDRRWKKGTRIVIGDEVYVSKGH